MQRKHQWKFGRTRKAMKAQAMDKCFQIRFLSLIETQIMFSISPVECKLSAIYLEQFSIECCKLTKAKPITYQLDFSANLKP